MKTSTLRGLTQINLFFEASTRTQALVELAGKRLGADVMKMSVGNSSVKKGETLIDTAMTLNACAGRSVVRHSSAVLPPCLRRRLPARWSIAGDGQHEHPTRRCSMRSHPPRQGQAVAHIRAICGRRAALRALRAPTSCCSTPWVPASACRTPRPAAAGASPTWACEVLPRHEGRAEGCGCRHDAAPAARGMCLGSFVPSVREYFHFYGLDAKS